MKEFWNERYAEHELAYGELPNAYFEEEIKKIDKPGKLLLPMEGQGRNAVFAAKLGWDVTAFDFSEEAKNSALKLAEKHNVKIDYRISSMEDFNAGTEIFDAVALIYAHLPEEIRKESHEKLIKALKPDGTFILEGFEKKQLHYQSGGPKKEEMLYSVDMINNDFKTTTILNCKELIIELTEGKYHIGEAAVVRFTGEKK
jgi:2-polyprenyl-3-methyl-5-hydroxy-6-metoxy-1,4-benzoquinol methylase